MAKKTKRARKTASIASMSIEALFNLRDEIAEAISSRALDLQPQLRTT